MTSHLDEKPPSELLLQRLNSIKLSFRTSEAQRSEIRNPGKHWMPDQVRHDEIAVFNGRVNTPPKWRDFMIFAVSH
jgi:hypothetical protein